MMTASVVVLNASYEPHQVVSLQHAIRMLVREVAVVEEQEEGLTMGPFPVPKVVRLVRYVYLKLKRKNGVPRYSRNGVLRRDNHKCAYCGKLGTTIDHVLPRSKGGQSSWLNSVAACRKCNEKKANRTPEQARMKLLFKPFEPTFFDMAR